MRKANADRNTHRVITMHGVKSVEETFQELYKAIEDLKKQTATLKGKITRLQTRVNRIEELLKDAHIMSV